MWESHHHHEQPYWNRALDVTVSMLRFSDVFQNEKTVAKIRETLHEMMSDLFSYCVLEDLIIEAAKLVYDTETLQQFAYDVRQEVANSPVELTAAQRLHGERFLRSMTEG